MVQATLDGEHKPVLGDHPFFNLAIAKWFRPWTPGDFTIPNYGTPEYPLASAAGLTPSFITVDYDTAFKNVVFQDTLIFSYVPASAGLYQFDNQNFFPLDGKGFGEEGKDHNFSFSMELHWQFTMEPGLNFQFNGDDDVWAFINNKLVIDVGGRHNPLPGVVNVDTLGLVNGQAYSFDFFYCERHTNSATIKVITNLFKARSDSIRVTKSPALDTVAAGDSVTFSANISGINGVPCPSCNQNVSWTIHPSTDSSYINHATGPQTTFHARTAYQSYTITAQYDNPEKAIHFVRADTLYVIPGAPDHLVLEANPDSMASLRNDAPIIPDPLIFSSGMLNDTVYAVLRDHYGNWVGHATLASWQSSDTAVITASSGRTQLGEGILTRQNADGDTVIIIASQGDLKDSLYVITTGVNHITKIDFSAWANDNGDKKTGIDNDDFVLLSFETPVPIFPVTATTIDSLFPLSNGHSWLSGAGSIGGVQWNADGTKLLITLSTQTAPPTIRIGDTILCLVAQNRTMLTGSFGPLMFTDAGTQPIAPAELISVFQSSPTKGELVFAFSSPAVEKMRIHIIDMFGRLISVVDLQSTRSRQSNYFVWDYRDNGFGSRRAKGIYCARVYKNNTLIKSVRFVIK